MGLLDVMTAIEEYMARKGMSQEIPVWQLIDAMGDDYHEEEAG